MFKHILMPVDGTEFSERAIDTGVRFAKSVGARITGFIAEPEYKIPTHGEIVSHTAVSMYEHAEKARAHAKAALARIAERAQAEGVEFSTDYTESDRPVDAIVADTTFPSHVPLSRVVDETLTQAMTEYVVLHVLAWHRRQRDLDNLQKLKKWRLIAGPRADQEARSVFQDSIPGASGRVRSVGVRVRQRGYATEDGEVTPGLASVATAAVDHTGRPVAGIAVTFRADDVAPDRRAALAAAVGRATIELSRRLGARQS